MLGLGCLIIFHLTSILFVTMWVMDEITCLGNMPSPKVGGPLSVMKVLRFATSTWKQNHVICIVASWDLHMFRKMQIWFCSLFLFTTLTISAHENINPQGETLKLETRDSTKHSLEPTRRRKQRGQNLFCFSPVRYAIYSYISFVQELSLMFTTAPLHHVVAF